MEKLIAGILLGTTLFFFVGCATAQAEPTSVPTEAPTQTPQPTDTPEPTSTPTNTPEPTLTRTPTRTPDPTRTPRPTITPTPTLEPELAARVRYAQLYAGSIGWWDSEESFEDFANGRADVRTFMNPDWANRHVEIFRMQAERWEGVVNYAPVPDEYQEFHAVFEECAQLNYDMYTLWADGLEEFDGEKLLLADEIFDSGIENIICFSAIIRHEELWPVLEELTELNDEYTDG